MCCINNLLSKRYVWCSEFISCCCAASRVMLLWNGIIWIRWEGVATPPFARLLPVDKRPENPIEVLKCLNCFIIYEGKHLNSGLHVGKDEKRCSSAKISSKNKRNNGTVD